MGLLNNLQSVIKTTNWRSGLVRGAMHSFLVKVCAALVALLLSIVLARLLGVVDFGTYSLVLAMLTLLQIPVTLGLPHLIVREVAIYLEQQQWALLGGMVIRASQLVAAMMLLLCVFSVPMAWRYMEAAQTQFPTLFLIGMPLLMIFSLIAIYEAVLCGLNRVIWGQLFSSLLRPLIFVIFFILLAGINPEHTASAKTTLLLHCLAAVMTLVFLIVVLRRSLPAAVKRTKAQYASSTWLKKSVPFLLIGSIQVLNSRIDIVMLGIFHTPEVVGVYQSVVHISNLVVFCLSAINIVISPHVAKLHALHAKEKLQKIISMSALVNFFFALPMVVLFIFFAAFILTLLYGDAFATGERALQIIAVGQLFNATMGSVGTVLMMTGHSSETAKAMAIAGVANIVLNWLLIPGYGMIGAAIASACSLILWNTYMGISLYKHTRLVSLAFYRLG